MSTSWIAPNVAIHALAPHFGGMYAAKAIIAGRLAERKISARSSYFSIEMFDLSFSPRRRLRSNCTERFEKDGHPQIIGPSVWSSLAGNTENGANWDLGSFVLSSQERNILQKYTLAGVKFKEDDINGLIPPTQKVDGRERSGRPKSEKWHNWVAELALYVHDEGVSPSLPYSAIYEIIFNRATARGVEVPDKNTVDPTIRAVFELLRNR